MILRNLFWYISALFFVVSIFTSAITVLPEAEERVHQLMQREQISSILFALLGILAVYLYKRYPTAEILRKGWLVRSIQVLALVLTIACGLVILG